jgi:hypothetical protein
MSIVALKRKTAAQYKNNSVGQAQFSIVGTHRSQGFIGQSTQSRFLTRTLMRGDTARGHGGCCGKYPKLPIVIPTEICTTEDSRVVKTSSEGNLGMLLTKYRWVRRSYPYSDTKTVVANTVAQSDYIDRIKKLSMQETEDCGGNDTEKPIVYSTCDPTKAAMSIRQCVISYAPVLNKTKYLSQSDYIEKMNQACSDLYDNPMVSGNTRREPIG